MPVARLPAVRPPREAAALAAAHYGLVEWYCRRCGGAGRLDADGVRGAAHEGLMRAAALFDPARTGEFSTYAAIWMARHVQEEARLQRPGFVMPRFRGHAKGEKYRDERERAARVEVFSLNRRYEINAISPDRRDEAGGHAAEFVPTLDPGPGPDEIASDAEDRRWLREQVSQLPERDRTVLTLRYGLDGDGEKTFREVGAAIGRSGPRARQLAAAAVSKLRACAGVEP